MSQRLQAGGISKAFPGVVALDGVSVSVSPGEVLAIVGENGAGKSTLMKILAGVYQPDAGTVSLDNKEVCFTSPSDALNAGVVLIHQELNLAENLSVVDNLFLGREKIFGGPLRILKRKVMVAEGQQLLQRVGLPITHIHRLVGNLPPGEKQLVEIARALSTDVRVMIMDEPTSSLTHTETEQLYKVIAGLKASGVSVLYISHRLNEVKQCADRVVVLRDGKNAGELNKDQINHENIVRLMVGRDLKQFYPREHRTSNRQSKDPYLVIDGIRYRNGPDTPVSLDIRPGEVLGMAGLVGAGRTELSEAIFGIRHIVAGSVSMQGNTLKIQSPSDAIAAGIALVPENRRDHGLVIAESVGANLSLPNLDKLKSWIYLRRGAEREFHQSWIDRLRIKTPSAKQIVGFLSGGNQQKVVYGKWLAQEPSVLILDEPTRGVDVGAKAEIYTLIDEMAGRGVAVWMITSDLEELLGMSDRVAVMHEGRLAGILNREQLSEEAVMTLATGGK